MAKPMRSQGYTKNYRQLENLGAVEIVSPGKSIPICCPVPVSKTKQNRTHIGSIICSQQIIFRNVYAYAYVHPITISERKDLEFEGEQEGVYGMAWKEEKEGKLL